MDGLLGRELLDAIDARLRTGAGRTSVSALEYIDALLELRSLTADLIVLDQLEHSFGEAIAPKTAPRRRALRSRAS